MSGWAQRQAEESEDFYNEYSQSREELSKLNDISIKLMLTLQANGMADFLLLKDDQIREWWNTHLKHQKLMAELEGDK